jgi:colanic acid biosynthesis glycosyl transferase WcaI
VSNSAKKPSIRFVNQHYWPDLAATAQHLTDLAEHLATLGFEVEVIASRSKYLSGAVDAPAHEVHNGVTIRRMQSTGFGRGSKLGHLGRLVDYATYFAQVVGALAFARKQNGVVFLTTPPLLSFVGAVAKAVRGQRYAVWSMDLHPDAEIAEGMLDARSLAARLLNWTMEVGYRNADVVIDLGAYMKRRIVDHGVAAERTCTIPVWSRRDEIEPRPRDGNPLRRELGVEEKFVVMYSGNAGLVHEFEAILEAMRRLKSDRRFFFVFVCGGPRRASIEAFACENGLTNFAYRGYFPREQLTDSLSIADAHLLSLRASFVGIAVPAKLYGIMASGRPALFLGPSRSESADTIRDADCGVVVDPSGAADAAGEIVAALSRWADHPETARASGARGRATFLKTYEQGPNCDAFAELLTRTFGAGREEREERVDGTQTLDEIELRVSAAGSHALN